jgi:hypothetical protein
LLVLKYQAPLCCALAASGSIQASMPEQSLLLVPEADASR